MQGTGQKTNGANPGDGLATDSKLIRQRKMQDPNPFFKALLRKPYRHNVVVSPHFYPAGEYSPVPGPNTARKHDCIAYVWDIYCIICLSWMYVSPALIGEFRGHAPCSCILNGT